MTAAVTSSAVTADVATLLGRPFTADQAAAITAPLAPSVIVAGAGSGKTAVMAARVVHLVRSGHVQPGQVLGLTFTNKAATELANRIRSGLAALRADSGYSGTDIGDEPAVSTYNAYAGRLVADHGLRIGIEPGSRVITQAQQWQLATRAVRAHREPLTHLRLLPRNVAGRVIELASQLADHLVEPDDVRAEHARIRARIDAVGPGVKGLDDVVAALGKRDELLTFVESYTRLKRERDLIDFGDQVQLAARVAEQCPAVGETEREQYAVVLLDEYQDTGIAQRRMLQALYAGGHPVTAVGDPCQSIYGWRGASVGNLLHFPNHFPDADGHPARVHYLSTNFRSGGKVLAAANELSAPMRSVDAPVAVPELSPRDDQAEAGRVTAALLDTVDDEASWIADRLVSALDAGTRAQDIAVLCRRRSQFEPIRRELEARDVPVEVVGLGGLLDTPEVNDIVSVLELLDDPTSNAAMVRLLTGSRWRIGPRDLAALGARASVLARSPDDPNRPPDPLGDAARDADPASVGCLLDALDDLGNPVSYSAEALDRFSVFAAELEALRQRANQPLTDLIQDVERTIGLDVELLASPGLARQGRAANVAAFLDEAARFVGPDREQDLSAFLAFLQTAREQEDGLDMGIPTEAATVKLMTVHAAKGLEWDVVFVPGLAGGARSMVFPAKPQRSGWVTVAEMLPNPLRGDRADLPEWHDVSKKGVAAFLDACRDRDAVEERRLGYVAFTRAKDALHISGYHWGATQAAPLGPSKFLTETCDRGLAEIDVWSPPPPDDAVSPLAGTVIDTTWPTRELADHSRLAAVAAAVRHAIDAGGDDGQMAFALDAPDDDSQATARWDDEIDLLLAELAGATSGDVTATVPTQLSVSTLVELRRDPGALAQQLARPLPRRPAPAARRGTAFHTWVEGRGGQRQLLGPDDLHGAADEAHSDAELAELQAHFLRTRYAARAPVEVEVPFELTLAGHTVRGRIDAVYADDDGGFDVVDYKTGSKPTGADAAAAAIQLSCYRIAWAALSGVPLERVRVAFLYVADESVVRPEVVYDADQLAVLLADLPSA